ncbi:ABC-type uncharacterized transport system permease subunit [Pedobacter africanus]|uniref:ABC-type uncharacterized transport system permease subunit n=1 Tax=Pedobacter africanus TaxID=151894 RepID=A0ACC6L2U9_9SPHI|nr:ABC-type uncharacterized transport system permease subunit [Pedobacter africanus]
MLLSSPFHKRNTVSVLTTLLNEGSNVRTLEATSSYYKENSGLILITGDDLLQNSVLIIAALASLLLACFQYYITECLTILSLFTLPCLLSIDAKHVS